MNLAAWFIIGILTIHITILLLGFRILRAFGGELRKPLQLIPAGIVIFLLAASFELLRHLGIIKIQGLYPSLECLWILIIIAALYRIHQLFIRLAWEENLTKTGD